MKIPQHKRFLFTLGSSNYARVGVIHKVNINKHVDDCFPPLEILDYDSTEDAFAATFRYASKFIGWIDGEWQGDAD